MYCTQMGEVSADLLDSCRSLAAILPFLPFAAMRKNVGVGRFARGLSGRVWQTYLSECEILRSDRGFSNLPGTGTRSEGQTFRALGFASYLMTFTLT
jgi:hypothetical protein